LIYSNIIIKLPKHIRVKGPLHLMLKGAMLLSIRIRHRLMGVALSSPSIKADFDGCEQGEAEEGLCLWSSQPMKGHDYL
jgi:hypothetical protein